MLQEVTIRSETNEELRSLLEAAIRSELKSIQHGINRTNERLSGFETRYKMSTEEFLRRFNAQDLGESLDFIEWMGEVKTLRLLNEKQGALKRAEVQ
jgi:hypothetical protein